MIRCVSKHTNYFDAIVKASLEVTTWIRTQISLLSLI